MDDSVSIQFDSGGQDGFPSLRIFGVENGGGLQENGRYEYELSAPGFSLREQSGVIRHSRIRQDYERGTIEPGNYVGLLKLVLLDRVGGEAVGETYVEVRSRKLTYESEYRRMLEDISERCTDLLLQLDSPVEVLMRPDDTATEATLAQRLYFLKGLLGGESFQQSVQRILSMPNTCWREEARETDVHRVRKLSRAGVRQLATGPRRVDLPASHPLRKTGVLSSVPERIEVLDRRDTVDTPENRFVKYALELFLQTLEDLQQRLAATQSGKFPGVLGETKELIEGLEETLSHSVFKEVARPEVLPLNSPVLQRKEGYRQVYRAWMLFELAARLSWEGGEDVYAGGRRDAAALYEYWVFFRMLDLVEELFELEKKPLENLITTDDLVLRLKAGRQLAIQGSYAGAGRRLRIEFSYNRTFSRSDSYPAGGSWTRQMRPDYTLSLWPEGFSSKEAERQELITHVHFDAKYKLDRVLDLYGQEEDLSDEEVSYTSDPVKAGNYKRADLLKMHAYRDAIRRTAGAYVLYPGQESDASPFRGFHELLPGLGAFPLRPDPSDDGSAALKGFLKEIVAQVCNRATQYEQHSWQTYRIHKDDPPEQVREDMPETDSLTGLRGLPATEISVLVGYVKSPEHLKWIQDSRLYNFRTGSGPGSLALGPGVTDARYVLLHEKGELKTSRLYAVEEKGPKIYAKEHLIAKGYPTEPSQPYYTVYRLVDLDDGHPLHGKRWDIPTLPGWTSHRGYAWPFCTTLAELMRVKLS